MLKRAARKPISRVVRRQLDQGHGEDGFTLMEIIIAILVLGIIMTAAAPAFYGLMRASAASDQRSVADGLAVQATEQIRSYPYYDVGYSTTPGYCNASGLTAVLLTYPSPMDTVATTSTVGGTKYTVQSCVYWQNASDGNIAAYKQLQVLVTWGSGKYKYSQNSTLYPGAEGPYTGTDNNYAPGQVTATTVPGIPGAPVAYQNSFTVAISSTIAQIDWSPVSFSPAPQYVIEWWDASGARPTQPATVPVGYGSSDGAGGLIGQVPNLSAAHTYDFDVVAVSSSQTKSAASNVVSVTTASPIPTGCTVTGINVAYPGSPSSPVIDKNGVPVGWTSLTLTVSASNCTNLTVEYGINSSGGDPQAPLTTVPLVSGGSWTGSVTQSTWSATTYGFVVYNNGTPWTPTIQQNVTPCQEKGNSGHC
jgi:prepilin-type N-terminal cleavage/methylation domain-containing protein